MAKAKAAYARAGVSLHPSLLIAIEACWLLIIIGVPLLFLPNLRHSFLVPKVALLRSVVGIMVILCLALLALSKGNQAADSQEPQLKATGRPIPRPIIAAALLFALINIVATVTSVSPQVSLWGYVERMGGLYTLLSFIAFCLVVGLLLRSRAQIERLVWAIVLSGSLVSLYGLLEWLGWEPLLDRSYYGTGRIGSTVGNPIFLGAYLITVIPFTVAKLISKWPTRQGRRLVTWWPTAALELALALQLTALVLSQARGPWLGFAVMASVFAAIIAIKYRRRWLLGVLAGLLALAILFQVGLAAPRSPVHSLSRLPIISRFSEMSDTSSGSGRFRLVAWRSLIDLLRQQPTPGSPHQRQVYRLAIGYGPETTAYAFEAVYPVELSHLSQGKGTLDRAHNLVLELAVTTGLLGTAAFALLLATIYFYLARHLRRACSPTEQPLVIATIAALSGHIAEQSFGIAQPADQVQFWAIAALSLAVVTLSARPAPLTTRRSVPGWSRLSPVLGHVATRSLLAAFAFVFTVGLIVYANVNVVRADAHFTRAVQLLKQQDASGAVRSLRAAVKAAPYHTRFYVSLAQTYAGLADNMEGKTDKELLLRSAAETMEKAERLEPLNALYFRQSARTYSQWAQALDSSKAIQADDRYRRASQLSPYYVDLLNEWARFRASWNDYAGALDILQTSLARDPEWAFTYYELGKLYQQMAQPTEAAAAYQKTIELRPGEWGAYLGLAQSLLALGRFEEALSPAETYSGHVPEDWQGHMVLASIYSGLGLRDAALREVATAIPLAPEASQRQLRSILEQLQQR